MLQLKIEISESMPKLPGPAHYSQFDLYAVLLECIESIETGGLIDPGSGTVSTAPPSARVQTLMDARYTDPAREIEVIVHWQAVEEMLCHPTQNGVLTPPQKPQKPKVLYADLPVVHIFSLAMANGEGPR